VKVVKDDMSYWLYWDNWFMWFRKYIIW